MLDICEADLTALPSCLARLSGIWASDEAAIGTVTLTGWRALRGIPV